MIGLKFGIHILIFFNMLLKSFYILTNFDPLHLFRSVLVLEFPIISELFLINPRIF